MIGLVYFACLLLVSLFCNADLTCFGLVWFAGLLAGKLGLVCFGCFLWLCLRVVLALI